MEERPVVGVMPLVDTARASYWMLPGYFEGLEASGAIPLMLPLTEDRNALKQLMQRVDGLLFTGGQDVQSELYGESTHNACGETCPQRDDMEKTLLSLALQQNMPILGICRGIQLLNAVLGGTLWQDLPTERPSRIEHCMKPPYDRPQHLVQILPNTPLFQLLGAEQLPVNSYHHQAVRQLAPSLQEMARSEDGLIEAVCLPDARFAWAVQWHPEFSFRKEESSMLIFRAFAEACRKYQAEKHAIKA